MMEAVGAKKFADDGFLVLEDFITEEQADRMRAECHHLVDKMNPAEHHTVFSTTKQNYRDEYFINSADKIGYFFEDGAMNNEGELTVPKHKSLNKIGHALHVLCPEFRKFTFSDKIKNIVQALGFIDPVVVQSMYIFKQPHIGGEVRPHQDASYLYVQPLGKVIGVWVALEDTTLQNGCLWFIPGSHKDGLNGDYRMIRNPKKDGPSCIFSGTYGEYDDSKFVPVPIKKGSLILIDGLVAHKSEKNTSEKSRHIYTFHIYDQASTVWSNQNWLQATEANNFTAMEDVVL